MRQMAKKRTAGEREHPIWTGDEMYSATWTWPIFWDEISSQMIKAGCFMALKRPRPVEINGTTPTAIQRRKEIREWEIDDQKAQGHITESMPSGTTAGIFVHRWMEQEARLISLAMEMDPGDPHPDVTAVRMRDACAARFAPTNNLMAENRQKEWNELKPELKAPLAAYADLFLFATSLYEETLQSPLDDATKLRRLTESLSGNKEESLITLAMGMQIDVTLTFDVALLKLRRFDQTQYGQMRIATKNSRTEQQCSFCHRSGHVEKDCRKKSRSLKKKPVVSAVSAGRNQYPYRLCSDCDRQHAGICWEAHPDKAPKGWQPPTVAEISGKLKPAKAAAGPGRKVGWTEKLSAKPRLKNPKAAAISKVDSDDDTVSMISVGLVDSDYRGLIAVDTGAQTDLVILNDKAMLEHSHDHAMFLGTAEKGGRLNISHMGHTNGWDNIFVSSNILFSMCAGGYLRSYGYMLFDSCPPIILDRSLKPVLEGMHVKDVPSFSAAALFSLPRLTAITLDSPIRPGEST